MTGPEQARQQESDRQQELAEALAGVRNRVAAAARAAGREPSSLTLVAVSKTWPASDVELLRRLGVEDFGENRDQEAAAKAAAVPGVRWHFVGRLQSNKARSVAAYASLVHSVDGARVADALSRGAERAGRELGVLLQVSLDGDPGRGGVLPEDVPGLADAVAALPGLRLGGVMAVAPLSAEPRAAFGRLAAVSARLRTQHPHARIVSAGMSGDLEAAVAAGSTHLRVGTALFGHRPPVLR